MFRKLIKKAATVFLLGTVFSASAVLADETSPIPTLSDGFRFSITPYLWAAGIAGDLDHDGKHVHTHISSDKVLSNLAVGAMLDGEVHYGRWGLYGNGVFAKLSNVGSTSRGKDGVSLDVNSNTDAWLGLYTVAGTYTVYASKSIYLDVLAGARFLNLNSKVQLDVSIENTSYKGDRTLYSSLHTSDAIAGVKGRFRLGESSWYVPIYLDAGGGSAIAKVTSQQALGVGYAFKGADVALFYTNIYYSLSNGNMSSYINMSGPAIAATFRF